MNINIIINILKFDNKLGKEKQGKRNRITKKKKDLKVRYEKNYLYV